MTEHLTEAYNMDRGPIFIYNAVIQIVLEENYGKRKAKGLMPQRLAADCCG